MRPQFNPYSNSKHVDKEHELMISNLKELIKQSAGKEFLKYLLKHFGVAELPPLNLDPDFRADMTGFLRAGQSIFEIASEADSYETALILSEIQKEKYNAKET